MIVTVTLNPTLDKTLGVPQLVPGTVHRARFLRQDLGGKGINVSRALRALGIPSRILCFLGGGTGKAMRDGLVAGGYDVCAVKVSGETRQNLTLLDEATGVYTKINEPGPTASPENVASLRAQIAEMATPGDLWAFCGSLPPGAPPDLYADLIRSVQAHSALAFLDSSGEAFRLGLTAGPFAIKPNSEEAEEALGYQVRTDEEHRAAIRELQRRMTLAAGERARLVCLTRGARGLLLAFGDECALAEPPPVPARSPVGAGDAALAGLLWAVVDKCDAAEAARRAVACGTAAALQEGTGVGDRELIESILRQVAVVPVRA